LLNAHQENCEWEEFQGSKTAVLGDLLEDERYLKKRIQYEYDLGAGWKHYVTVVKRAEKGPIKITDAEGGALIEYPTESEDDLELDLDLEELNKRLAKFQEKISSVVKAEDE
jgi:hypothetical protein